MPIMRTMRKGRGGWRGRGLGITSAIVNGGLIYGSSPVGRPRPVGPARYQPVSTSTVNNPASPTWGNNPARWNPSGQDNWPTYEAGAGGSYYGSGSQTSQSSQSNLAQLVLLYQSNPSSLTAGQWSQLQAAGVIPATVPYGDASLIAGSTSLTTESAPVAAAAPTAATSTSFLGTDPTNGATTILGIDWYWLAAGLGLIFVFTQKRGR